MSPPTGPTVRPCAGGAAWRTERRGGRRGAHDLAARRPFDDFDVNAVGTLNLLPQTENLFTVFKDGWHPAEAAAHDPSLEWQWTKQQATLAFKNPKKDALFYFDVDSPGSSRTSRCSICLSAGMSSAWANDSVMV